MDKMAVARLNVRDGFSGIVDESMSLGFWPVSLEATSVEELAAPMGKEGA